MDRLNWVDSQIVKRKSEKERHRLKAGTECGCYAFCSEKRWLDRYLVEARVLVAAEFERFGYPLL